MPIKRTPTALKSDMMSTRERYFLFFSILAAPLTYLCLFMFKRRRDKISNDQGFTRRQMAYKAFRSRLKSLNQDGKFFEEASLLLREYLGNKFNFDGKAITPIDAERKLKPYQLSTESIRKIEAFLKECEAGQFGGTTVSESGKTAENIVSIVDSVEKAGRR